MREKKNANAESLGAVTHTHTHFMFTEKRERQFSEISEQKGITLVALVVTIIVIIILATVSISAVFSENGIIKKAELMKKMQANSIIAEEEDMNRVLGEYANMMASEPGGEVTTNTVEPPEPEVDNSLPTAPKVATGMQPVKWNGSSWQKVTDMKTEWYNYDSKNWANVVLGNAKFNSDGTLDESQPYSQLVWIPRYAYQITSQYHTATTDAGNINVVFVDTNNQNKSKNTTYKSGTTNYPSATAGASSGMSDYIVHPAFDYDGNRLSGFWIGKFESNHTGCTTAASTGDYNGTDKTMMIKAGVTSWRGITIGNMYDVCLNMNKSGNIYGLNPSDSVVDPHLTKNSEWGAVAYLSRSKYGKQNEEVYINNNSNYITGIAGGSAGASSSTSITNKYNTTAGMKASTSGTIYGVYDMSGGAYEYVAGYVNNGNENLTKYGSSLVNGASKYREVYTSSGDSQSGNYGVSTPAKGHYGDAVYETSSSYTNNNSWYSDYSRFPYSSGPFFERGSGLDGESDAGVFYFGRNQGNSVSGIGFHVVVTVL